MELVELTNQSINATPIVSADAVASRSGISHKSINGLITKHRAELERSGNLLFKKEGIERKTGLTYKKVYLLNEQQTTFLVMLLKNTPRVVALKNELSKRLCEIRNQQAQRQMMREFSKEISKDLNQSIKENVEVKHFTYANFNKLVYKSAIEITTSRLRKYRNIPQNGEISAYLTIEEFKAVNAAKVQLVGLLNQHLTYDEIKRRMLPEAKVINLLESV